MVYERGESPGGGSPLCSSPLARGTCSQSEDDPRNPGFIPARVGNTSKWALPRQAARAHPRSRGEHFPAGASALSPVGSSPLARGTHIRGSVGPRRHRLIPARAGNTQRFHVSGRGTPAHPRSRGEHSVGRSRGSGHYGSSPLARGTLTRV